MQDPKQLQKQTVPPQTNITGQPAATAGQQSGDMPEPAVITGNKEQEPTIAVPVSESTHSAETVTPEITTSLSPEVMIPQELKNIVEHGPDGRELKLEKEIQKVTAVTPAVDSTPIIKTPTGTIHLPMNYPQALQKLKNTEFLDSTHWLAAMIMYQWCKYDPDAVKDVKQNKQASI